MPKYHGHCHCGSIHFDFESAEITTGLRCNCSMCARKGAVMLAQSLQENAINIEDREGTLNQYQFGTGTAKHFFCNRCGIYTFHQTRRAPGEYRVNLACIDEIDVFTLPVQVFDGKHAF